jgi:hypothetical protein
MSEPRYLYAIAVQNSGQGFVCHTKSSVAQKLRREHHLGAAGEECVDEVDPHVRVRVVAQLEGHEPRGWG